MPSVAMKTKKKSEKLTTPVTKEKKFISESVGNTENFQE